MIVEKTDHLGEGLLEYCVDMDGDHRFRIKGLNNEIIITSEGYDSIGNARRGLIRLVQILKGVTEL